MRITLVDILQKCKLNFTLFLDIKLQDFSATGINILVAWPPLTPPSSSYG